jgi:hypothetical protein
MTSHADYEHVILSLKFAGLMGINLPFHKEQAVVVWQQIQRDDLCNNCVPRVEYLKKILAIMSRIVGNALNPTNQS